MARRPGRCCTDLQVVRVPGQADLMFCREQGPLTFDDLERVLKPCRAAYEEPATLPQVSPHARFDILDWMPLAPVSRLRLSARAMAPHDMRRHRARRVSRKRPGNHVPERKKRLPCWNWGHVLFSSPAPPTPVGNPCREPGRAIKL